MDLPAHVISGALLGNAAWYLNQRFWTQAPTPHDGVKVGIASFLIGVLAHLFFDAIPHFMNGLYLERNAKGHVLRWQPANTQAA